MAGRHAAPTGFRTRPSAKARRRAARGVVPLAYLLDEAHARGAACRWCADTSSGTFAGHPVCSRCRRRRRAVIRALGRIMPTGMLRRVARA